MCCDRGGRGPWQEVVEKTGPRGAVGGLAENKEEWGCTATCFSGDGGISDLVDLQAAGVW